MPIDVDAAYRLHHDMVHRRCAALLGDPEAAREAAQDTFLLLVRHRERIEAGGLSSLLYQMATRVCLNRQRTTRRRPVSTDRMRPEAMPGGVDAERRAMARRRLEQVLEPERPSTRVIAVMHLRDGYTLEEVADEVGMSRSGVRKRLRKLRAQRRRAGRRA